MDSQAASKSRLTDIQLETIIGNLLRGGVMTSAIVVAAAGVFYLIQHHADRPNFATFHMERNDLREIPAIVRSTVHLQSDALIQFGLVLLIATPIARVALAAVGFYLERDAMYVAVSLIVLSILIFSIMHAV